MSTNSVRTVMRPPKTINKVIYRRLMPLLIAAYVMAFLDRTNIGMAKDRLEIDLGLSATAYGIGAGIFFLTYALSEIPSNLIMHKVGARFWIMRIMITWGLLSAGMAFVQGETSFYIMRMLLGIAEAGLFPSCTSSPSGSRSSTGQRPMACSCLADPLPTSSAHRSAARC